jgi:hypothetical protein
MLVFTFIAFFLSHGFGPEPKLGPAGLTDDRVVVSSELSCLHVCLHVHDLSPLVELLFRHEWRVAKTNEQPCCDWRRAFLP